MMDNMLSKQTQRSGFSLIEILVALGLFAFVSTAATAGLLTLLDASAKAQTLRLAMDNLAFTLDNMSRNIRTGNDYYCRQTEFTGNGTPSFGTVSGDCTNGQVLAFTDVEVDERVYYRLANGQIDRHKATEDKWIPVTANNINIDELLFTVAGSDDRNNSDYKQPTVTIWIRGTVGSANANTKSEFKIQTTVTQRILDI